MPIFTIEAVEEFISFLNSQIKDLMGLMEKMLRLPNEIQRSFRVKTPYATHTFLLATEYAKRVETSQ